MLSFGGSLRYWLLDRAHFQDRQLICLVEVFPPRQRHQLNAVLLVVIHFAVLLIVVAVLV